MSDVSLYEADFNFGAPKLPPLSDGAMKLDELERMLTDTRNQPVWREEANEMSDFYDGLQLDAETIDDMKDKGLPPVIINLVKPTIDAVLGMETKTRTDWVVKPDDEDHSEMATAISKKLKAAENASRADRACSDAYGSQVKTGIGWVEVSKESDPFKFPIRCQSVHRREIWWDWRAKRPDLEDARFIIRKKWYDADFLQAFLPGKKDLIAAAASGFPDFEAALSESQLYYDERTLADWDSARRSTIAEEEWRDTDRERIAVYEVWYRIWEQSHVFNATDNRVVKFDKNNPEHIAAYQAGLIQPRAAVISRVRVSYWLGPYRLMDNPSPYSHNRFPYVPFFGYREDRTGIPYGLIRGMKNPQEEVNARRAKMLWLLSSTRTIIDEDAVDDHEEVASEVARPDAYIRLNPNRQNVNAMQIDAGADLSQQQYNMMIESKSNVQDASGVYQEMLGKKSSANQSGIAIQSLIEQGSTTLGEINDNFADSRRLVGELLMSLLVDGMQQSISVSIDSADGQKKILLNHPVMDEQTGMQTIENDVSLMSASISLAETSNSATYRTQVLNEMLRLTQSLPPEIQVAVLDMVVDATDLPNKAQMIERIRAVTGQGKDQQTPEQQQQVAQEQAQQQQVQQRLIALEMAQKEAVLAKIKAETEKFESESELRDAQAEKLGHDAAMDLNNYSAQMNPT